MDNVVSQKTKVIITLTGKLNLDFLKEYLYLNSMHLMISWKEYDIYFNTYNISKYEINIIRSDFGTSG